MVLAESVAVPLEFRAALPMVVEPERNVTVPPGMVVPEDGVTVAVNAALEPMVTGLGLT